MTQPGTVLTGNDYLDVHANGTPASVQLKEKKNPQNPPLRDGRNGRARAVYSAAIPQPLQKCHICIVGVINSGHLNGHVEIENPKKAKEKDFKRLVACSHERFRQRDPRVCLDRPGLTW